MSSRSWRLSSADSSCSFFLLEDVGAISAQDCTTIKQHFTVTMTEQRSFHLKIFDIPKKWEPFQYIVSSQHANSRENRSYIFLQCKLKFFWNDLGTSSNISGHRPYAEHRFSKFPIQFNSLNPRKRVRSHQYDKDSPQSHKHTPTPHAFYLLIIQHR